MPYVGRAAFTVRVLRSGSAAPAGVGFVLDDKHIVTCAHVVNAALGGRREKLSRTNPAPICGSSGEVTGGIIQLDVQHESAVRPQPG